MPDFGFSIVPKNFFFDRAAVQAALTVGNRKALSKAGAFVRTRAQTSMRKRKAPSAPGQPPSVHVGTLKRLLFFSYDPNASSVVIGPVKFGRGEAPNVLEFGGETTVSQNGVQKRVTVKPRPYMGPALRIETERGNVVGAWADTFGKD
jgi:hypothetical protein